MHELRRQSLEDFLISHGFGSRNSSGVFVPVALTGGGTGTPSPTTASLAYYSGAVPQTYAALPIPAKPTTGWVNGYQVSGVAAGTTRVIENQNIRWAGGSFCLDCFNIQGTLIIRNCHFEGVTGSMVSVNATSVGSQVLIENCKFWGNPAYANGGFVGNAVIVSNAAEGSVTIQHNYATACSGFIFEHLTDNAGRYLCQYNYLHNISKFNASGGYTRANGIQFIDCQRVKGAILYNYIFNEPGKCTQEDTINMHAAGGTEAEPFFIKGNMINGVYVYPLTNTTSTTGSCITMDNDGGAAQSTDSAWNRITRNYCVGHTFGSANLAGGNNNWMYENVFVNTGKLPDGTTKNGTYAGGPSLFDYNNRGAALLATNKVYDNFIGVFHPNGNRQDIGVSAQVDITLQKLFTDAQITRQLELNMYHFWRKDAQDAGIAVGLLTV